LAATAVKTGHNRPDRCAHNVRDLLVGKTFHVSQVDSDTEIFGQFLQRALDVGVRQPLQGLGLRRLQPGGGVRFGPGQLPILDVVGRRSLRLALPLPVSVYEGVSQDAV